MSGVLLLILRIGLLLCLYAFLGYALLVIWRDLKRHSELTVSYQTPVIRLLQQTDSGVQPYNFTIADIRIGRDPAADCPLDDLTVSSDHARVSFRQGQWWVEDRGSKNGTFLNQELVSQPLVIASGDHLRVGQVTLIVEIGEG